MRRVCVLLGSLTVLVASSGTQSPMAAAASQVRLPQQAVASHTAELTAGRALITSYCVTCHNERAKVAGLMLDKMDLTRIGARLLTGTSRHDRRRVRDIETGTHDWSPGR